jgi:hypothetical protein
MASSAIKQDKTETQETMMNPWHTSIDFIIWSGIIFYGLNELLPYDAIALRYMTLAAIVIPGLLVHARTIFIIPRVIIACVWEPIMMTSLKAIKHMVMTMFVFTLALFVLGDLHVPQQGVWARAGKYFYYKNRRKICLRY